MPSKFEIASSLLMVLILLAVGFWVINPWERARQERDRRRLEDLGALQMAIDGAVLEGGKLPKTMGVPASSASSGASLAVGGSGWVEIDLSGEITQLPTDPQNGETFVDILGSFVTGEYQFICDGAYYVLRTHLEAEINRSLYQEDGNDNSWYEIGTAPGLSSYFGL
jgi:hypothetical protein